MNEMTASISSAVSAMEHGSDEATLAALAQLLRFDPTDLLDGLLTQLLQAAQDEDAIARRRTDLLRRWGGQDRFPAPAEIIRLLRAIEAGDAPSAISIAGDSYDEVLVELVAALAVLDHDPDG